MANNESDSSDIDPFYDKGADESLDEWPDESEHQERRNEFFESENPDLNRQSHNW